MVKALKTVDDLTPDARNANKGSMGIMSAIAKRLDNCAWNTARKYVNRWEETRAAYADES